MSYVVYPSLTAPRAHKGNFPHCLTPAALEDSAATPKICGRQLPVGWIASGTYCLRADADADAAFATNWRLRARPLSEGKMMHRTSGRQARTTDASAMGDRP